MGALLPRWSRPAFAAAVALLLSAPAMGPSATARIADAPDSPLTSTGVSVAQAIQTAHVMIHVFSAVEVLPDEGKVQATVVTRSESANGSVSVNVTEMLTVDTGLEGRPGCSRSAAMGKVTCTVSFTTVSEVYYLDIFRTFEGRVTLVLTYLDGIHVRTTTYQCVSLTMSPTADTLTKGLGYACTGERQAMTPRDHPVTLTMTLEGTGTGWARAKPHSDDSL